MTRTPVVSAVRMVDLAARHARVQAVAERAVSQVLRSGRFLGGPVVASTLAALAARHGVGRAVGAGSGTGALRLLLQATGVGPGDTVLVPALTFFATVEAVLQVGAVPLLVDVDPQTGLMDPSDALRAASMLDEPPRAVVPVWLFGNSPNVGPLQDALMVLDDAAQAVGRCFSGRHAALSLYPTKVLGGAGDGGVVLTDDAEIAERAHRLGHHGMAAPHVHETVAGHVGDNNRLSALQAAVVGAHLHDLDRRIGRRREIAGRYAAAFADLDWVPHDAESPVSVWSLLHPERDRLRRALRVDGIETAVYYPRALGDQPALQGRVVERPTPAAQRLSTQLLALPCHAELNDAEVEAVMTAVRRHA